MYSIILPHLKQRRKISFDISPLLYALHQPIISMDMDHGSQLHIAKLNGRLCGAKRPHSVSEQPNFYQSLQSNPYNDSSHPSGGE